MSCHPSSHKMCLVASILLISLQVDHLGGHFIHGQYRDVTIADIYFYLCTSWGFEIYDYSNPYNPQFVGRASTDGICTGIDIAGNYAYVADLYNGLCIFDICDPAYPSLIGHYYTSGFTEDVVAKNEVAYLADGDSGLVILDISDPSNPLYRGRWSEDDYYAATVFIADTIAYIGNFSHDPLKIVNVSNPTNPYLIADFPQIPDPNSLIISACVVDTLAFLTGSWWFGADYYHFLVANVSDPAHPSLVSRLCLPGPAQKAVVQGDYAYVNNQDYGIRIIDISNPETPLEIGYFDEAIFYGYGSAVYDSILICPEWQEGFSVVDISNPLNPIRTFHKTSYQHDVSKIDSNLRTLYLLSSVRTINFLHTCLKLVDIDDMLNPVVRSELNYLGRWLPGFRGPGLVTDYPYLAFGLDRNSDEFLVVLDITDIDQPQFLRFDVGTTAGPSALDSTQIYAGHHNTLMIGDIYAGTMWIDTISMPESCYDLVVDNTLGYAACKDYLVISDLVGDSLLAAYAHNHLACGCNGGIIFDFPNLYMSYDESVFDVSYTGFLIFDVSNASVPVLLVDTVVPQPLPFYVSSRPKGCYQKDTLFFLCRGWLGFDIWNVGNPSMPARILTQDTPYSCNDIHVLNDTIIVNDGLSIEIYRLGDIGVDERHPTKSARSTCALEIRPDPSRSQVCVVYDLQHISDETYDTSICVSIYDSSGRLVKSFDYLTERSGQIIWCGEDENGRQLPQGVYFIRLETDGEHHVRKVILLR